MERPKECCLYRSWFHLRQSISNENKSEQERNAFVWNIENIWPNELTMTQNSERPLKNWKAKMLLTLFEWKTSRQDGKMVPWAYFVGLCGLPQQIERKFMEQQHWSELFERTAIGYATAYDQLLNKSNQTLHTPFLPILKPTNYNGFDERGLEAS